MGKFIQLLSVLRCVISLMNDIFFNVCDINTVRLNSTRAV